MVYTEFLPSITNNQLDPIRNPQFSIDPTLMYHIGPNGLQFNTFKILYQKVADASIRPSNDQWIEIDYTNILQVLTSPIDPQNSFLGRTYSISQSMVTAGTPYILSNYINIPANGENDKLQFGDEVFLFGSLLTDIKATVYKTSFTMNLPFNGFNTSNNLSYSESSSPFVYISEVMIYDNNNNLVVVGKISNPIKKTNGKIIMIELTIDF